MLFNFVWLSSENLTTEGNSNFTLNIPVDISDSRNQEFCLSGQFLAQNITETGILAEKNAALSKAFFYSHKHLWITLIYYIPHFGPLQDSLTQTKRGHLPWSMSFFFFLPSKHKENVWLVRGIENVN